MAEEMASARTGATNTPFNPQNSGKMRISGITNKTCRDKLKKAAFQGWLMA